MHIIHFDCCVCLDTKDQDIEQVELVAGKWICSECIPAAIIQPFEAALQHEHFYPPVWDRSTPLDFDEFSDHFPDDFADAWRERIRVYETPVQRHVWCQGSPPAEGDRDESDDVNVCNEFLGELGSDSMGGVLEMRQLDMSDVSPSTRRTT
jgi:hypothetical protein